MSFFEVRREKSKSAVYPKERSVLGHSLKQTVMGRCCSAAKQGLAMNRGTQ